MKQPITTARRRRRQSGFSILEILIATVLISLLVASGLYYANVGDKAVTVDIAAAKAALAVRFPEAVMTVYAQKQTLAGTSASALVGTGSVRSGSPVAWAISGNPTASELSINLTFDTADIAQAIQTYLDDHKDAMLVDAATVDRNNTRRLKVTYKVQ